MSNTLCDLCKKRLATIFVTKVVNNETSKQRYCESCARQRAAGEGWMQHLAGGTSSPLQNASLDEVVLGLFQQQNDTAGDDDGSNSDFSLPNLSSLINFGELSADADTPDELDEIHHSLHELANSFSMEHDADLEEEQPTSPLEPFLEVPAEPGMETALEAFSRPSAVPSIRCPKCGTTWDRLRQDGRAGCANCYEAFHDQLIEVMDRLQRSSQHVGKVPRAALKRRRRLEHLRTRRDHRLEMLNRRLREAVAAEKYEDAAKLRDQIKIVASTIVSDE
jgi:protein-arginine kinase activator protein McsA